MGKILKEVTNSCEKYNLIEKNDKIAVGVSGGKDSVSMLKLLNEYSASSNISFDIVAIYIDMFNGQNNIETLQNFCKENQIELHIEKTQIFDIVFNIRNEKNPCSLCSKMRNGNLHSKAKLLNCNKVALGHHADDLIETFFLSMIYENRLSTFKPKTYLDRRDITIIRPLIKVFETQIVDYHLSNKLPLIKNPCPADKKTKRETVKKQIDLMNKTFPNSKKSIYSSIVNKNRYNLF